MFEHVRGDGEIGGTIRPVDQPRPGQNVISRGATVKYGQRVLPRGTRIRPAEVGILAELGQSSVHVVPQPQVAIIATGDELVPCSQVPQAGQIRNSNGPLLRALVLATGSAPCDLGIAVDDRAALAKTIEQALDRDLVLLSGGVSAGTRDLVPEVLATLNVSEVFHRVALKPGKPLWFGVCRRGDRSRSLVFGLPGNPVSGLVCFELFVRPALAALAGEPFEPVKRHPARLAVAVQQRGDRETYLPARRTAEDPGRVAPVRWQGSSDLAAFAQVNVLVVFPPGNREYPVGSEVEVVDL